MAQFTKFLSNNAFKIATASVATCAISAYGLSQLGAASGGGNGSCKKAYKIFAPKKDYPNLQGHNNCLAHHLTPKLYTALRGKVGLFH